MRVNIQYSVELDDVPAELETLVASTVTERLYEAAAQAAALDFDDRTDHVLSYIDGIRKLLYAVDERLSDVDNILRGWTIQQSESQQEQPLPEEEPLQAPPNNGVQVSAADEETMEIIKAKLSDFTNETDALRRTFRQGAMCAPSVHLDENDGADGD
tara:strand:- start:3607 stop:4077 length:471 start_codon:yes stop_codon:yes gene_type:complete